MDPITHGLMGACAAGAFPFKRISQWRAMMVGVMAGMSPDLDVFIRSADYPLLGIKFHRHFTHAIPVSPLWGLVVAAFLWWLLRQFRHPTPFLPIYLLSILAIICHGILDSMTNYGTHLFWPLTNARESWSIISIIDPLFTLPLLAAVIYGMWKLSRPVLQMALVFMMLYWSIGIYQHSVATKAMEALAAKRGHEIAHAEVKPSFGNLVVWRTQYIAEDAPAIFTAQGAARSGGGSVALGGQAPHSKRIFIDGLHHSFWQGLQRYAGGSRDWISSSDARFAHLSPIQKQDLQDFEFFSDGWLTPVQGNPQRFADARFGLLPTSLEPMWAVEIDPTHPERHAGFANMRRGVKAEDFETLWKMIKGEVL